MINKDASSRVSDIIISFVVTREEMVSGTTNKVVYGYFSSWMEISRAKDVSSVSHNVCSAIR